MNDGPTWLAVLGVVGVGTVLSAVISSAVTARSLRAQSEANDHRAEAERKHDAAQREADRNAESERRAEERRDALQDHWREERNRAHGELLPLLERAVRQMHRGAETIKVDAAGNIKGGDIDETISDELDADVLRALAQVNIYGGAESRAAAMSCWERIRRTDHALFNAMMMLPDPDAPSRAVLRQQVTESAKARGAYIAAVRAELGTGE